MKGSVANIVTIFEWDGFTGVTFGSHVGSGGVSHRIVGGGISVMKVLLDFFFSKVVEIFGVFGIEFAVDDAAADAGAKVATRGRGGDGGVGGTGSDDIAADDLGSARASRSLVGGATIAHGTTKIIELKCNFGARWRFYRGTAPYAYRVRFWTICRIGYLITRRTWRWHALAALSGYFVDEDIHFELTIGKVATFNWLASLFDIELDGAVSVDGRKDLHAATHAGGGGGIGLGDEGFWREGSGGV